MRQFLAGIVVTVGLLAVIAQLGLPAYFESRVEDRLEEGGGSASVSIGAFPAITLVGGRGESFEADGRGLSFDLAERREEPFERLDGFAQVDVDLDDVDGGALQVERFELSREGRDAEYDLVLRGTTTPRELAQQLGSAAAGPLGGLLGSLATGVLPGEGTVEIPLELRAKVDSADGRTQVFEARGSVGGLPAGPLAEVVLGAVLDRL